MTEDVVRKSFKACGISVSPDWTKDNEIHCLQSSKVTEDAASLIVQQTAELKAQEDVDNDCDPFADEEEDDSDLEINEVVIDNEENDNELETNKVAIDNED